jgi:hypothetical protein
MFRIETLRIFCSFCPRCRSAVPSDEYRLVPLARNSLAYQASKTFNGDSVQALLYKYAQGSITMPALTGF